MSDYLYIIKCDHFYKIGICANVRSRLIGLQVGNPYALEISRSYKITNNASKVSTATVEILFHRLFRNRRVRGEWFEIQEKELPFIDEVCTAIIDGNDKRILELRKISESCVDGILVIPVTSEAK